MANGTTPVIEETVQSRVREDDLVGFDILPMLLKIGDIIPAWWSKQRDYELGRMWMQSDHVAGAISMFVAKVASIPVRVVPRDASIKAHVKQADNYTATIVDGSDFFAGWHKSFCPRMTLSWLTKDNGMFTEVIGSGKKDKPRPDFLGLAYLDPRRCQRTSNPEYPVNYTDTNGKIYRLHHGRVAFSSAMPSDEATMNGVGFCSFSRMIRTTQHFIDISTMEQEKLGSRPHRQMILGKGVSAQEIISAFMIAENQMDNQGLTRYAKSVILANKNRTDFDVDTRSLLSAPDGYDKETSITLGMFAVALALNIPPRWIWPASQSGATKADAMFQHVAGIGGGIGNLLMVFKAMFGGGALSTALRKAIPSHLKLEFDFQDDQQDRDQAEIRGIRAVNREKRINDGEIDIRTARLLALDAGDLSEAEFNDLELGDGRLPDGQPVLNLFMTDDRDTQAMLALSVGDVLNVAENDKEFVLSRIDEQQRQIRAELMNPSRPAVFGKAKQAFAALDALKELYGKKEVTESTAPVVMERQEDVEPVEDMEPVEDEEQKAFRKYGSTQFNFPQFAQFVDEIAAQIDPKDWHEEGIEDEPHVTIKYGLIDDNPNSIVKIAETYPPFDVGFGKLSLFQNDDFDVLKIEANGRALRKLNEDIAQLPSVDTHNGYNPHLTIGYLMPGTGEKYLKLTNPLEGQKVRVTHIMLGRKNGNGIRIPLGVTGDNANT